MLPLEKQKAVNRLLGEAGLGQLSDPGLIPQLASFVRDHAHFRSLLVACEPEHRYDMYQALAPRLAFKARTLDEYIAEARNDAAARQLPTVDEDGKFRPYSVPEIGERPVIEAVVQEAVEAALLPKHLRLMCSKCTREATFHGVYKSDTVEAARKAGWLLTYVSGEPKEICPDCRK